MRLLLFFVSFLFSFLFYVFHSLSLWLNIFWWEIYNEISIESLSWNLLIESSIFFLIGVIFVFYFTPNWDKWENPVFKNKKKFFYIIFYILSLLLFYLWRLFIDSILIINIVIFVIWDLFFNIFSNIKVFENQKNNLRYAWLILNYIAIILWLYNLYFSDFSIFIYLILVFSIIFNVNIHFKYTNYISLLFSILTSWLLIYNLLWFL